MSRSYFILAGFILVLCWNCSTVNYATAPLSYGRVLSEMPRHPDVRKCYVRIVTPVQYDTFKIARLAYTEADAKLYPHRKQMVTLKPEIGQWVYRPYPGCKSTDPKDCQMLCWVTEPAEVATTWNQK